VPLLRFVALYSFADAWNIIFVGSLQAAGDTRWTLVVSVVLHVGVLVGLFVLDTMHVGIFTIWSFATAFIVAQTVVWTVRFLARRWHDIRVIEDA
jgi:multidrug resistance protein, MATE family